MVVVVFGLCFHCLLAIAGAGPTLFVMTRSQIHSFDLSAEVVNETRQVQVDTMNSDYLVKGFDLDYKDGILYWVRTLFASIGAMDLVRKNESVITTNDTVNLPQHLSYDWIGQNFYVVDSHFGGKSFGFLTLVRVCTRDGRRCVKLMDIPGGDVVTSFALSPPNGVMFWSQLSRGHTVKILKGSMSAANIESLMPDTYNGYPSSLVCDHDNQAIYWLDLRRNDVNSMNFVGQNRRVIRSLAQNERPVSLSLFESNLYIGHIDAGNRQSGTKVFVINEFNETVTSLDIGLWTVFAMKVVGDGSQSQGWNLCANCTQLCLLNYHRVTCG